jgi:hypothetical protein
MILIDNEKSIMAGEAARLMAELAATIDRLAYETSKGSNGRLSEEEIIDKLLQMVEKSTEIRRNKNLAPNEIPIEELQEVLEQQNFEMRPMKTSEVSEALKNAFKKTKQKNKEKKKKKNRKKDQNKD